MRFPTKRTDRAGEAGFIKEIVLVEPLTAALDRLRLPNILAAVIGKKERKKDVAEEGILQFRIGCCCGRQIDIFAPQ